MIRRFMTCQRWSITVDISILNASWKLVFNYSHVPSDYGDVPGWDPEL